MSLLKFQFSVGFSLFLSRISLRSVGVWDRQGTGLFPLRGRDMFSTNLYSILNKTFEANNKTLGRRSIFELQNYSWPIICTFISPSIALQAGYCKQREKMNWQFLVDNGLLIKGT